MKVHEKLKQCRLEANLSLRDLSNNLLETYKDAALNYHTLSRIENGHHKKLRPQTLSQLSTGLGITLGELLKNTELELSKISSTIKRKQRGTYTFNPDAKQFLYTYKEISYKVYEIEIEPSGKTDIRQDPNEPKYSKMIVVIQGEVECHVGNEITLLRKGDGFLFDSDNPHYYRNISNRKTAFLVIQNPKSF